MSKIILAVDYGERRLGIAISDPSFIIASPYYTIDTRECKDSIGKILDIASEEDAGLILLGYPYNVDDTVSDKARDIDKFIAEIKKRTNIPVATTDERYSSVEAKRIMVKKKKKKDREDKKAIDRIAAAIFLQRYIEENDNISL